MYQPKVKFVLQYKNKHFSFDAYSSSGSSQFTATLQLAASVGITHPPHSHRKLSLRENLPLKDFIGNMEVLSVSKPAGIVKKSSQSDVILHNFAEDLAGAHQTEVKCFFLFTFLPQHGENHPTNLEAKVTSASTGRYKTTQLRY